MAQDVGMLGFADKATVANYRMQDEAFYLGNLHPDHKVKGEAGIKDDRHVFVVAGSRAGKGTTIITSNLLSWEGGVLVIDPKGENASLTACRRASADAVRGTGTRVKKHLGQKVGILDPFNTVRGAAKAFRVTYDPIQDIEKGTDQEAEQILGLVEGFVMDDAGNSGLHFTENVSTIFAGVIEAVLHHPRFANRKLHRMATVVRLMRLDFLADDENDESETLHDLLSEVDTDAGLAQEAASVIAKVGHEEAGSFSSTASRQLKWLFSPLMRRHLTPSDFSLKEAVRDNWSIYVCIPPSKIPRYKRWLRIITKNALDAKMDSPFEHEGQQSLFLLDEFSSLGHFQIIEDAAAYMAGYGIKLVPIIQNLGQVKKLYEKNWETFLGNAGAIILWGLNDHESEQYASDRMGRVMTWEKSHSVGGAKQRGQLWLSSLNVSESASMRERAVRLPNEVHAEGARDTMRAFIIPASSEPFMVQRREYEDVFADHFYESPSSIRAWEAAHG